MKKLSVVFVALVSGCLAPGCKIQTKNQGEMGFRWGSEFTLFSRAAQTAPEPATIESSSQPLLDYLAKKNAQPPK